MSRKLLYFYESLDAVSELCYRAGMVARDIRNHILTFGIPILGGGVGMYFVMPKSPPPPRVLNIPAETVTGSPNLSGPYTLVEFTDYECPPCRKLATALPNLIASYKGKLRFVVRQLPLPMHKNAFSAACAAEAAREQGKFPQMYDALMQSKLLSDEEVKKDKSPSGLR